MIALRKDHRSNRLLQMQSLRYRFSEIQLLFLTLLISVSLCGGSDLFGNGKVNIEIPFAFRVFPVGAIEATGTQVLDQILRLMLPRFLSQVCRDDTYLYCYL